MLSASDCISDRLAACFTGRDYNQAMSTASPPPKIACPHCQALIKAPALAAGSLVNCPKCGNGFRLGEAGQETGDRGQGTAGGGRKSEVEGHGPGGEPQAKAIGPPRKVADQAGRSEEHTSELQSQ